MSRIYALLIVAFLLMTLAMTASATPIAGSGFVETHAVRSNSAGAYKSSLTGDVSQGHLTLATNNSSVRFPGLSPHQFAMRVPPPAQSETPEPSTLTLFGSGLMMVAGAVRRKFRG